MTNHHCARESITEVSKEGEDIHKDGFIAWELEDEIPVPNLYVEQCVKIEDVTEEIQKALEAAETDSARLAVESEKIKEIEKRYPNNDDEFVKVTPLYFGGKYSLYHYKKYNDVRLVFVPEEQIGYFGGDYDNFTYPRYNLDCSFFRVYDKDGKPLKTENYFKWSAEGAKDGEVVFVSGNPGSTNRLYTVAQLEYSRDYIYPQTIQMLDGFINFMESLLQEDNKNSAYIKDQLLSYSNSKKAYQGMLDGLRDPVLMTKKLDFENKLKEKVQSDPELNEKYESIWSDIDDVITETVELTNIESVLSYDSYDSPDYFTIASQLIPIANEYEQSKSDTSIHYSEDDLKESIDLLMPDDFNSDKNKELLKNKIDALYNQFGDAEFLIEFTDGKKGDEAAEDILSRTILNSEENIISIVEAGPDSLLNCGDPFIGYVEYVDQQNDIMSSQAG